MGREQGDHLPDSPDIYVGEVNGETVERPAYNEVDKVNLAARGWVQKSVKPAGKPERVVPGPSPRVEAANTGSGNA